MSHAAPTVVPRWSVCELSFGATATVANPYQDLRMTATFHGPDGRQRTVAGFWDGGNRFVVRFTPTMVGEWIFHTSSDDGGLDGRSGTLSCVAPRPDGHGFLRRDPAHPYHFVWDDGSRAFLLGQTYYGLVANARAGGDWRVALDGTRRYGMNKVRFLVYPVAKDPPHQNRYPGSSPFGVDHDTLDLAHWRQLDAVVQRLQDRGLVADMIFFVHDPAGRTFGTPEQDARYVRYLIARYAAFPNVIWCLTNEWNYTGKDRAYWNDLGRVVREEDPWLAEDDFLRATSIHQQTRIDFQFFDQAWPVHCSFQYGVRNRTQAGDEWADFGTTKYRHGDEWGNAGILFNWGHSMPVINDEYGYIGEPVDKSAPGSSALTRAKHRQILWGIYTAGGYGSAGDKYTYADGSPYKNANWHEPEEYGDLLRLVQFFTGKGLTFWTMSSRNDLLTGGERVYLLAEPGRQYVIYAAVGGPVAITLTAGRYQVRRFDARTGEDIALGTVDGGSERAFDLPPDDDWVLSLVRIDPDGTGR